MLLAGFFGAIGNTVGSWVAYYAGLYGGRPFAEKYGKYILVSRHDLDLADRFFARWGKWAVFGGRLLPVVRTFISVPAGISRVPIWQFTLYTFAGAFIWSTGLAYGGYKLGENWEDLRSRDAAARLSDRGDHRRSCWSGTWFDTCGGHGAMTGTSPTPRSPHHSCRSWRGTGANE